MPRLKDISGDIMIYIPVEAGVKEKDVVFELTKEKNERFRFTTTFLKVGLQGQEPVINGELWQEADLEETSWEITKYKKERCIAISLARKILMDWEGLLKTEDTAPDTTVTDHVFFDVALDGEELGRVIFGLYGKQAPKTAENFRALCTGERGNGKAGVPLHFKGSVFHRIIPGFMCQGGDFTTADGKGGESIYGKDFEDETLRVKHSKPGILSMANRGRHTNGSQFFITVAETPQLDGRHVVFGEVLEGYEKVVTRMEAAGSDSGATSKRVEITHCGELPRSTL